MRMKEMANSYMKCLGPCGAHQVNSITEKGLSYTLGVDLSDEMLLHFGSRGL
jgi:hypothetical protein